MSYAGNHTTMLELLEVPQLMDTCVRNGNYDDALDLKGFVGKIAFMHSDLKVVQSLVQDVDATSTSMLEQLLQKLRSNIQLPDCLRIIGYLRRLGVFSEKVSLCLCYLSVHHQCTVPQQHLKEVFTAKDAVDANENHLSPKHGTSSVRYRQKTFWYILL